MAGADPLRRRSDAGHSAPRPRRSRRPLGAGAGLLERGRRRRRRPGRHAPTPTAPPPPTPARRPNRLRPRPAPRASRRPKRRAATAASTTARPIDGNARRRQGGGVTHNQSIGDASGGGSANGGVSFPSATGGGDQPQPEAPQRRLAVHHRRLPHPRQPDGDDRHLRARPRSASPTSSSTPSRSRPSCCRSTRPAGPSTGSPGRCSPRSTKSRPPSAPTSTSPAPARSAGCSSCPRAGKPTALDANGDGRKDPYNPVDAICAAAHYLKRRRRHQGPLQRDPRLQPRRLVRAGGAAYARAYGKLPANLVGSLTGLTEGAHFPVAADARYADDISAREALKRADPGSGKRLRQRRRSDLLLADPARHQHLLPRRARRSSPSTTA